MNIGVLKEQTGENRVAILPETVKKLLRPNLSVWVETGAGTNASACDSDYQDAGAEIKSRDEIVTGADIVLMVSKPENEILNKFTAKQTLIATFSALNDKEVVDLLKDKQLTAFSMELVPRITRAQSMDVLSSMATVAGYKAVLDAANHLPTFFPMFMTAAGTIRPAKVLILGAGVAGLQAIAIARKLGAQVEVFDVRSAVKEQVLSLGAKFVEVEGSKEDESAGGYAVEQTEEYKRKQQEAVEAHAEKANVIISTAQIPGKKAPLLIKKTVVEKMKKGSVIVDLAASSGGNCELSKNNEIIVHNGITIIGKSNYPSEMPFDASKMYGQNMLNFLNLLIDKEANFSLNFEDKIIKGTCLTHNGEIISERVKNFYNK
ncbi:MAG: Re/Si-specific NAD(P)(+) transhydrogenase subunit alpha [Bacteroidales bacterium]|nr:Re/Si-specific NAD(P)(+) transhydrogenase subunit alpha [Bacteroidales bacterium]